MTGTASVLDELLADRYRLRERIAVGGMGEVWRADDTLLRRPVAVKTLKPEYADDADFRARFRAEAHHAGRLAHAGIAAVTDYGEDAGRAWLVMELVDGEPLSALLRRYGALPADQALDVVAQTAAALQAAHDGGVVHRDVKPGNLLVRPDGVVKITDFGIASAGDAVPLTRTGTVVGTAFYLSPEQAAGRGVGPASDVYSLAVVAFEMLTGSRPFPGENPVTVAMAHLTQEPPPLPANVDPAVRDLVRRGLSKDPAQRPPSAAAFGAEAAALRDRIRSGPATVTLPAARDGADRPSTLLPPRPAPHRRRRPRVAVRRPHAALAGLTVVTLLALTGGVRALGGGASAARPAGPTAPASVAVPAIAAGTPYADAVRRVLDAGLEPVRRDAASATVPTGRVTAVEPAAGTLLAPQAAVALVVSTGPPPVQVDPAGLVGRTWPQVRTALTDSGLRPTAAYDGSGGPAGTVSAVEPSGSVPVGSAVVVHVVPQPPAAPAPAPAAPVPAAGARAPAVDRGPVPGRGAARGKGAGKAQGKGKK